MQPLIAELSTTAIGAIGVGVVVVLALMYFVGIYNSLVALKNGFKSLSEYWRCHKS